MIPIKIFYNMWNLIVQTFKNYFLFRGRADRKEFWTWALAMLAVSFVFICILGVIAFINSLLYRDSESPVLSGLFTAGITLFGLFWLVMFIPSLTVSVRRLRDAGITPWLLIIPIALGIFTFLVLCDQALYNMDPSTPARYSFAFACIMTAISAVTIIIFIALFCKPSKQKNIKE